MQRFGQGSDLIREIKAACVCCMNGGSLVSEEGDSRRSAEVLTYTAHVGTEGWVQCREHSRGGFDTT